MIFSYKYEKRQKYLEVDKRRHTVVQGSAMNLEKVVIITLYQTSQKNT